MIEHIYIKGLISFKEVNLKFDNGLIVLSGPSGAGKSILMQSILSCFGYSIPEAKLCEVTLSKPKNFKTELYEIENEIVIKSIKKDRARFYLNNQNISKKSLQGLFSHYIYYLNIRDKSGFESTSLISLLDDTILTKDKLYKKLLKDYKKRYKNYSLRVNQLNKMRNDENKLLELIEFAQYEIDKIKTIDPKSNEDIELIKIKQQLSKIDKINESLDIAMGIFNLEPSVQEVFRLIEKEDAYFTDTMNQLRADFEETQTLAEELSDIDVEDILNRLEEISWLKNRYGSIDEALKYKELKEREIIGYKSIEQDKSMLESFLELEFQELMILAQKISIKRKSMAKIVEDKLLDYLTDLKLSPVEFKFSNIMLNDDGIDNIDLELGETSTISLSGGEFNRLRLALLVIAMQNEKLNKGVLILDEIDANVSGDESIAISKMIAKLSTVYQVFAISHQAHLSAKADQHILVNKDNNISVAKILNQRDRITEITRIIGGKNPDKEAIAFAKRLRGQEREF